MIWLFWDIVPPRTGLAALPGPDEVVPRNLIRVVVSVLLGERPVEEAVKMKPNESSEPSGEHVLPGPNSLDALYPKPSSLFICTTCET